MRVANLRVDGDGDADMELGSAHRRAAPLVKKKTDKKAKVVLRKRETRQLLVEQGLLKKETRRDVMLRKRRERKERKFNHVVKHVGKTKKMQKQNETRMDLD